MNEKWIFFSFEQRMLNVELCFAVTHVISAQSGWLRNGRVKKMLTVYFANINFIYNIVEVLPTIVALRMLYKLRNKLILLYQSLWNTLYVCTYKLQNYVFLQDYFLRIILGHIVHFNYNSIFIICFVLVTFPPLIFLVTLCCCCLNCTHYIWHAQSECYNNPFMLKRNCTEDGKTWKF